MITLEATMTRICAITRKKTITGHNISHANNKTKRNFKSNIHTYKFHTKDGILKINLSANGLRFVNKYGIDKIISSLKENNGRI